MIEIGSICQIEVSARLALRLSVQKDAEAELQGGSAGNSYLALFSTGESVAAKRIGGAKTVIAGVEPAAAEIRRVRHQSHADPMVANKAAVVAPGGHLAPHLFFVGPAIAVPDLPTLRDGDWRSDANAQPHFLLVTERKIFCGGRKSTVPMQQKSGRHL